MTSELVCLTPVECAIDTPIGEDRSVPPLPKIDVALEPLTALEQAVLPALQRAPCVVSFSGGLDSSAVLAIAARVARRESLPLPVPTTLRYPENPEADESHWQELVIRHLNLPDWNRLTIRSELDLIGPVAQQCLRRHGLLSPCTAYSMVPIFQEAAGGTVLTGFEGDGLFGGWGSARVAAVLSGQSRPMPRDVLRGARAAAPRWLRATWLRRRRPMDVPWLRLFARDELESAWAAERASEPRRWDRRVSWWARLRRIVRLCQALDLLGQDSATHVVHPFLNPAFLAALAHRGGRAGFGDRLSTMRKLFGQLLPPELHSRTDKADFTLAIWNEPSRSFRSNWNGQGIPEHLVDEAALRRAWEEPDARSGLLLQAAWLTASGLGNVKQMGNCRLE